MSVVEELGSESFVHVRIEHQGGEHVLVVRDTGETDTERGDRVHVSVTGRTHVFNAAGERVGD